MQTSNSTTIEDELPEAEAGPEFWLAVERIIRRTLWRRMAREQMENQHAR